MTGTISEQLGATIPSLAIPCPKRGKVSYSDSCGSIRGRARKVRCRPDDTKFGKAFRKSLVVRSRVLKRLLTRDEWVELRNAVRRQVRFFVTPLQKQLYSLVSRVSRVERATPCSLTQVDDAISVLALRTQILQRQINLAWDESTRLSETCSHAAFRKRIVISAPVRVYSDQIPGFGFVVCGIPANTIHACCACQQKRDDAVFEWIGSTLHWGAFTVEAENSADSAAIKAVPPLAHSKIWSAVLDLKYSR